MAVAAGRKEAPASLLGQAKAGAWWTLLGIGAAMLGRATYQRLA